MLRASKRVALIAVSAGFALVRQAERGDIVTVKTTRRSFRWLLVPSLG